MPLDNRRALAPFFYLANEKRCPKLTIKCRSESSLTIDFSKSGRKFLAASIRWRTWQAEQADLEKVYLLLFYLYNTRIMTRWFGFE